jgi:hypothetical protein|tara:strand:+ start:1192 stop:1329 length:138 start_codon:yes stop_codon:yes gene_type:complete
MTPMQGKPFDKIRVPVDENLVDHMSKDEPQSSIRAKNDSILSVNG